MADNDQMTRLRVAELLEAIECVRNPFRRAELIHRLQALAREHNHNHLAEGMRRDSYEKLYNDVADALVETPKSGPDKGKGKMRRIMRTSADEETLTGKNPPLYNNPYTSNAYPFGTQRRQQEPITPSPAPRPRHPLLAEDKTIRSQNIFHNGVSERSREDARYQMAAAARKWEAIGGHSDHWNKLKAQSGVANKNNSGNTSHANVFGRPPVPVNNTAFYPSTSRRNKAFSTNPASTPPARNRSAGASAAPPVPPTGRGARDARILKKPTGAKRATRMPPAGAAPPPMAQNLQQLSNYIRSQAPRGRWSPSSQTARTAQTLRTLRDADNDVIMRDLMYRQNQSGKRQRM